jgi:hypothetical protein
MVISINPAIPIPIKIVEAMDFLLFSISLGG